MADDNQDQQDDVQDRNDNQEKGDDAKLVTIYVGNLPYETTQEQIEELFKDHGKIHGIRFITNQDGSSKGFCFVEMSEENAENAVSALDGDSSLGRELKVNKSGRGGRGGRRDDPY
eukprot:TRINITY_DN119_c0_g1_i2.p1 TRINITY_DN119_c0_g1~~TRINITY_DN119_c0_g1_i2.p1  ORF type:complete len:116 (-),score=28.93 TRINITY_DN119_c0_g1_i2:125-472(-)